MFDWKDHAGLKAQALIELALLLPIMLLLILGALDFGRLFYLKIVLTNAAREGAYTLSMHACDVKPDPDDGETYKVTKQTIIGEASSSGIGPGDILISIDGCILNADSCCQSGTDIDVSVSLDSTKSDLLFFNFLSAQNVVDEQIGLSSTVTMVIQ